MSWTPLKVRTHFSLQRAFTKPDEIAKQCKQNGYTACAITDLNTISGAVAFYKACKKHGIKPIIGCTFEVGDSYATYIAKNKSGWYDLIGLVTKYNSNSREDMEDYFKNLHCPEVSGNLICIDGINQREIFYIHKRDADLHRLLLCAGMKTTLTKVQKKMKDSDKFSGHQRFFDSDDFSLPSPSDVSKMYSAKEIKEANDIADSCEEYDVLGPPMLPHFECPKGYSENEYLKQLCRDGWQRLLANNNKVDSDESKDVYLDRIQMEMGIVFEAKLSGYFLIVQDIVNYVRSSGWLPGPGRGSAAGCLISYLIGITEIDPIEYDLIFERFYNMGRNTGGHVSLPDIDVDVPAEQRDLVIDYIKQKYGVKNVSQMLTFSKLQGRAALKEVMRIDGSVSFAEMNDITKNIPNEADISDQLEETGETSLIRWALVNESENLVKWCRINDDNSLDGPLSNLFEQAIRLEGTYKSQGKHAAGVIISSENLEAVCPMVKDRSGNLVAGFEMGDLEDQGHVKFDILGIDLLNKIMEINV